MGRTVLYEKPVEEHFLSLLKDKKNCIGFLVGQSIQQRDIVVHAVRTPQKDDQEESKAEGKSKLKNKLDIDEAWLYQHAKQVTRMLPGGLDILGIFIMAPVDIFEAEHAKIQQILQHIFKNVLNGSPLSIWKDSKEKILLHFCLKTQKITCKTHSFDNIQSSAKPADWRPQTGGFSSWHKLQCQVGLDLTFPLKKEMTKSSLLKQMQVGLSTFQENIINSLALINDTLRDDDEQLDMDDKKKKAKDKIQPQCFTVDLLVASKNSISNSETIDCSAIMSFKGNICSQAYVHGKATIREALQAVKQDILRSAHARCEIQCEDLLLIEEEQHDPDVIHELPKRVFTSLPNGIIDISDYVFHGDSASDTLIAFEEIMDLKVEADNVEMNWEQSPNARKLIQDNEKLVSECENVMTTIPVTKDKNWLSPVVAVLAVVIAVGASCILLHLQ